MKQATLKILVIEDDTDVRDNIEEILELSDYEVMTAANGRLGLEVVQSQKPDLIICDVMMPELDGYGVVKSLRENPETSNIPVIFLTAKVERSDQRIGMNLGADDYLTKPFLPKELLNAVDARLQRQKIYQSQVQEQQQKTEDVRKEADKIQLDLEKRQQMLDVKDKLLNNLIQELTSPISSINLALKMVNNAQTEDQRQHYINILQEECQREIQLLNEISKLQQFLQPENIELLQRFKLLK
ncbi:MAG: response regulator [Cyanobacteria bacterium J06592_8]